MIINLFIGMLYSNSFLIDFHGSNLELIAAKIPENTTIKGY
jgi:hypothetical protein